MLIVIENVVSQLVLEEADEQLRDNPITLLRNYLKVKDKNAFWGRGNWDGMRYYCSKTGVFATGFLPSVLKFFKKKNLKISIHDNRVFSPDGHYTRDVGDIRIRKYQYDTAMSLIANYLYVDNQLLYFPRGVVDAATNAGKDYIALVLHEAYADNTLYICPNKQVFEKAKKFYEKIYPNEIGFISASPRRWTLKPFTLAIIKTLHNRITKYANLREQVQMFNTLMVDEAHLASSKTYQETLRLINSTNRFFFSGTALDHEEIYKRLNVVAQSGPVVEEISNKDLIEKGVSAEVEVNIHLVKNPVIATDYRDEYYKYVINNERRLQKILDICKQYKGEQILISHDILLQGKLIYRYLKDNLPEVVIERTDSKDSGRFVKEKLFNSCDITILIASMIFKMGINVNTMRHFIRAEGLKSEIVTKQYSIGRLIRKEEGYTGKVKIHDFFDVGKYVAAHSRKRIKTYLAEGLDVIYHYDHTKTGSPKRYLIL